MSDFKNPHLQHCATIIEKAGYTDNIDKKIWNEKLKNLVYNQGTIRRIFSASDLKHITGLNTDEIKNKFKCTVTLGNDAEKQVNSIIKNREYWKKAFQSEAYSPVTLNEFANLFKKINSDLPKDEKDKFFAQYLNGIKEETQKTFIADIQRAYLLLTKGVLTAKSIKENDTNFVKCISAPFNLLLKYISAPQNNQGLYEFTVDNLRKKITNNDILQHIQVNKNSTSKQIIANFFINHHIGKNMRKFPELKKEFSGKIDNIMQQTLEKIPELKFEIAIGILENTKNKTKNSQAQQALSTAIDTITDCKNNSRNKQQINKIFTKLGNTLKNIPEYKLSSKFKRALNLLFEKIGIKYRFISKASKKMKSVKTLFLNSFKQNKSNDKKQEKQKIKPLNKPILKN